MRNRNSWKAYDDDDHKYLELQTILGYKSSHIFFAIDVKAPTHPQEFADLRRAHVYWTRTN